jgi:hypothetical protein
MKNFEIVDNFIDEKTRETLYNLVIRESCFAVDKGYAEDHQDKPRYHVALDYNAIDDGSFEKVLLNNIVYDICEKYDAKFSHLMLAITLFGYEGHIHTDDMSSSDSLSILVYIHPTWKRKYLGHTLFIMDFDTEKNLTHEFDSHYKDIRAVFPQPKRAVVYDGSIPHIPGIVSRECYIPRAILTMRFKKNKKD